MNTVEVKMPKEEFWKNFTLGIELDISGKFIYNGLWAFDQLEDFRDASDIFEVFYNLSVGIERLQKVVIILTEYDCTQLSVEEFEKSLITHNHQELMKRINGHQEISLSPVHNKLLSILSTFYNSMRYDRFSVSALKDLNKEKKALIDFIFSELKLEYSESLMQVSENTNQIKKFFGKIVSKIVLPLYKIIFNEAHRLGLFTYELKIFSKAYSIFLEERFDFIDMNRMRKELLIYLINNKEASDYKKDFLSEIKSLDFDVELLPAYIRSLLKDISAFHERTDEVTGLYSNVTDVKTRLELIDYFGSADSWYSAPDDYEYNDEEF